LKYKVGDRVFYKGIGWGTVKGFGDSSCFPYAVEFDRKNSLAHSCGGLCKYRHGFYISEFSLSRSDSLWNDIRIKVGKAIIGLRRDWKGLTPWGKFITPLCMMFFLPIVVIDIAVERYCDKDVMGWLDKKISSVFRIYKE